MGGFYVGTAYLGTGAIAPGKMATLLKYIIFHLIFHISP